jgi:predicted transcriptional regulator
MPVVENGKLIGIVGEADLYRATAAAKGVPLGGTVPFDALGRPRVVSDVMRRGVLWVKATDSVALAAQLLMRHARSLPVIHRGRVVGMVTRRDVLDSICDGGTVDLVGRAAGSARTPHAPHIRSRHPRHGGDVVGRADRVGADTK